MRRQYHQRPQGNVSLRPPGLSETGVMWHSSRGHSVRLWRRRRRGCCGCCCCCSPPDQRGCCRAGPGSPWVPREALGGRGTARTQRGGGEDNEEEEEEEEGGVRCPVSGWSGSLPRWLGMRHPDPAFGRWPYGRWPAETPEDGQG